jgi:hypothetical protein
MPAPTVFARQQVAQQSPSTAKCFMPNRKPASAGRPINRRFVARMPQSRAKRTFLFSR